MENGLTAAEEEEGFNTMENAKISENNEKQLKPISI
jgi:hypothetical protein